MFDIIKKNKFLVSFLFVLIIFLSVFTIISFDESYSLSDEDKWDGVSVSDSFDGGIGTEENPYLISSGAQFLYFKKVIEEQNALFSDKYYKLTTNINLSDNTIDPIGDAVNYFKGNFDGDGFGVYNFKIEDLDDNYYGVFSRIDGSINNLNLRNITVRPNNKGVSNDPLLDNNVSNNVNNVIENDVIQEGDTGELDTEPTEKEEDSSTSDSGVSLGIDGGNSVSVGILAGEVSSDTGNNSIFNISIVDSSINLDDLLFNESSRIGGLFGYINKNINVKNIYLNYEYVGKISNSIAKVIGVNEGNVENVILKLGLSGVDLNSVKNFNNIDLDVFTNVSGSYKLGGVDYTVNQLLSEFNNENNDYYWEFEEDNFIVYKYLEQQEVEHSAKMFMFSATATALHSTGVDRSTVYINDLDADRANFDGLNYTDYTDIKTLPSGNNRNLYNDNNLVRITVTYKGGNVYSGVDYNYLSNSNQVGYVSLTEQQDTFVYYKWYKVSGNTVTIELIDSPYGDRPDNMGFNGWLTNYPGATVSLNQDIYVRYATIPVTYTNGKPNPIDITFYASWFPAKVYEVKNVSGLTPNQDFKENIQKSPLNNAGLVPLNKPEFFFQGYDIDGSHSLISRPSYPANSYKFEDGSLKDISGDKCPFVAFQGYDCHGSDYYIKQNNCSSGTQTYYYFQDRNRYTITLTNQQCNDLITIVNGIPIYPGHSAAGLYDSNKNLIQGTSTATLKKGTQYYYLATRDTNIALVKSTVANHIGDGSKPATYTSVHNGVDYNGTLGLYHDGVAYNFVDATADLRIEHVNISSNGADTSSSDPPKISTGTGGAGANHYIYGKYHNLKIGRGIKVPSNSGDVNALGIMAGDNETKSATYRLIVESGRYNFISLSAGDRNDSGSNLNGTGIYGSDYDRAINNNNNLQVYYSIFSNWGTSFGSSGFSNTIIKSGNFAYGSSDSRFGVWAGGRNCAVANNNMPVSLTVEGGIISSLNGGNIFGSGLDGKNAVYINIKGGTIGNVYGGSAFTGTGSTISDTYGNRIINMTGGRVNGSVFGGSNMSSASGFESFLENATEITGATFVYVNGSASIGGDVYGAGYGNDYATKISNRCDVYIKGGTISGSVFGAGRRRGNANNVSVNIDGGTIGGSVYGSGRDNAFADSPVVHIRGGTISSGNVYGGGINANVKDDDQTAIVNVYGTFKNTINNVFGGSQSSGEVINSIINISGGIIKNLYGGNDSGGYTINSTINIQGGKVTSVYGGGYNAPFGNVTVSGSTITNFPASTNVNIRGGTVTNVYGGGHKSPVGYDTIVTIDDSEGNPVETAVSISGSTAVNITGGTIGAAGTSSVVYGGGYQGSVNGNSTVNLSNVAVDNVYGGSYNSGDVKSSSVNINSGGKVANLFGGGHNNSNVLNTSVTMKTGSEVTTLYGGNNGPGIVKSTDITVSGGTVNTLYGGNAIKGSVTDTFIKVSGGVVTTLFGSGNVSDTTNSTNVTVSGGNVQTLYGGGDSANTTKTTTIVASAGTIGELFGGGVGSNSTGKAVITLSGSTINNAIYGGGNGVNFGQVEIKLTGGSTPFVYGGSKTSGTVASADISVGSGSAYYNDPNTVVYGGGNGAAVSGSTSITTNNSTVKSIYGGGKNSSVGTAGDSTVDLANISISNSTIVDSVYGGGDNGDVNGDIVIKVDGASIVNNNVFGGSRDGSINNPIVNIAGGHIKGNVYGSGSGSISTVIGDTIVNIGKDSSSSLSQNNITIDGDIYGNDSSLSSGNINVNVNGKLYNNGPYKIKLGGNIIGNSSGSIQMTKINILEYGIKGDPSKILSIKNATETVIDKSFVELGDTDINGEVADYSFDNIDELKIKNSTYLHLQKNTNNLGSFESMIGNDFASGINNASGVNRIYLKPGVNFELRDQDSYSKVKGMTFAGMYDVYKDDSYRYGIFADNIVEGSPSGNFYEVVGVSTISGVSDSNNHEVDGFYTNYLNDDYETISVRYIDMIDKNDTVLGDYHEWMVYVRPTVTYNFDLIASKYSSLGTYNLSLDDEESTIRDQFDGFKNGSTTFDVVGVNVQEIDANLILSDSIKTIADSQDYANNNFGLEMRSESFRWKKYNSTQFFTANQGSFSKDSNGAATHVTYEPTYKDINGQTADVVAPSLDFYLYHSKNISNGENVGKIIIYLLAKTKDGDESRNEFVAINVNIGKQLDDSVPAYDASITYGKKYEIPVTTSVNITNRSQFTAYFSLYNSLFNGYESKYHVLKTTYRLPQNTQITMIDFSNSTQPKYYYYTVDNSFELDNSDNKYIYKLNKFIKMGSVDANYQDKNSEYIINNNTVLEEFLFIFDFKNSIYDEQDVDNYSNKISFELTDGTTDPIKVLPEKELTMNVNLYGGTSDIEFDLNFLKRPNENDINIRYDEVHTIDLTSKVVYKTTYSNDVINTNLENGKMGLNIVVYKDDKRVGAENLLGTTISIDGINYYCGGDGVFRIKLSDKLDNVSKTIDFSVAEFLESGPYVFKFILFASSDGYHNSSHVYFSPTELNYTVLGNDNYILVDSEDETKVINGSSSLNNAIINSYNIKAKYENYINGKVVVKLYKKDNMLGSTLYNQIDIKNIFDVSGSDSVINFELDGYEGDYDIVPLDLKFKNNLTSGTYRLVFGLYDGDNFIDEVYKYVIIKKSIIN